jgi:FAD/FMN-containing dehydrogenase
VTAGGPVPALLTALADIVGPANVVTDPDVVAAYAADWTGRFRGTAAAVVRPADTAEVAAVVSLCRTRRAALVPQGGNTGLVGGGVPLHGEVVLSLRRLAGIGPVDEAAGQLTAGAGATIAAVRAAAEAAGWEYGVDLGSRDSATVGGTIGTNAGGLHMLRHGDTRAQVVGVEAVLGTGAVVSHLGGLLKDNTGYALAPLFCGSEGTLAVVTAARLRLVPRPTHRVVALLAFDEVPAAIGAAHALRRALGSLEAAELMLAAGVGLVCETTGAPPPFPGPHAAYLLVEAAAGHDPTEELGDALARLAGVAGEAVAVEPARRRELWNYRESHPPSVNGLGAPHKLDVTLPADAMAAFVAEVPGVVAEVAPEARTWLWGHVADGNIHVNVTGVEPDDERIDDAVFHLVARRGGSISAEHGIGAAKRRWLHLNRSAAELDAFRAIKRALDPDGILNPHVLLPTG